MLRWHFAQSKSTRLTVSAGESRLILARSYSRQVRDSARRCKPLKPSAVPLRKAIQLFLGPAARAYPPIVCQATCLRCRLRHHLSGEESTLSYCAHVASVQTLWSWSYKLKNYTFLLANLVIVDERNASLAPTYLKIISDYHRTGATVIGLTATPVRG